MIIECAHCATRYNYDESKFGDQPSKKIRCAKCKEVFEIRSPKLTGSSASAPETDTHDETFVRRSRREAGSTTEETNARVAMSDPKMPDSVRLSLAITEGPGAAQVFRIERPVVTVGRAEADIVLPDQESSRQHAEISIRDGHYFLTDLDSRNGTWIEGQKIEGEVEIFNQSEFRVGATTLMLIVTSVD